MWTRSRISIHAPTRGATMPFNAYALIWNISIHAPTRGATSLEIINAGVEKFQSTLPRGERHKESYDINLVTLISIHAPTRGATFQHIAVFCFAKISIHAPTRGATFPFQAVLSVLPFQSTLPRGERPSFRHLAQLHQEFQSTLPRGERRF